MSQLLELPLETIEALHKYIIAIQQRLDGP